jgi:hypothetical protein
MLGTRMSGCVFKQNETIDTQMKKTEMMPTIYDTNKNQRKCVNMKKFILKRGIALNFQKGPVSHNTMMKRISDPSGRKAIALIFYFERAFPPPPLSLSGLSQSGKWRVSAEVVLPNIRSSF